MSEREQVIRLLSGTARRLLAARTLDFAACGAIAGAAVAAGALFISILFSLPLVSTWWFLMPLAGGAAAAFFSLVKGTGIIAAGIFLDLAFDAREQFSTAGELAERRADSDPARYIYRLAVAGHERLPRNINYHRRGRKTLALLLLVLLLCFVVQLTAAGITEPAPSNPAFLADIRGMTPAEREKLAADIRALSGGYSESEREALEQLAAIADAPDDEAIDALLRKLDRSRIDLAELVAVEIPSLPGESGTTDSSRAAGAEKEGVGGATPPAGNNRSAGTVTIPVYNPRYAAARNGSAAAPAAAARLNRELDAGQSWGRARRTAAAMIRAGDIPVEYRTILRSFFLPRD